MTDVGASGEDAAAPGSTLDLTDERTDPAQASPKVKTLQQQREDVRKAIAVGLLAALALLVLVWGIVALWADPAEVRRTEDAFRTVFAGLLGLTGTVVGFYFGNANDRD